MINSADTAYYTSIAGSVSSSSNWLASTETAIQNSQNQGGLLGMLSAATDGSVSSFLSNSATSANAFATISQTSVSSASTFYAQIAAQNVKTQQQKKLQDAMDSLQAQQQMVPVQSTLDPFIYFPDGSNINEDCGCTHPAVISALVKQAGATVGISHDGDADRVLLCDETGLPLSGDEVIAIAATHMLRKGTLKDNTIAATVMSNYGLDELSPDWVAKCCVPRWATATLSRPCASRD